MTLQNRYASLKVRMKHHHDRKDFLQNKIRTTFNECNNASNNFSKRKSRNPFEDNDN